MLGNPCPMREQVTRRCGAAVMAILHCTTPSKACCEYPMGCRIELIELLFSIILIGVQSGSEAISALYNGSSLEGPRFNLQVVPAFGLFVPRTPLVGANTPLRQSVWYQPHSNHGLPGRPRCADLVCIPHLRGYRRGPAPVNLT